MRRLYVTTTAAATVTERWVVEIDDDVMVSEANALDMLDGRARFVSCEDEVSDEHDRLLVAGSLAVETVDSPLDVYIRTSRDYEIVCDLLDLDTSPSRRAVIGKDAIRALERARKDALTTRVVADLPPAIRPTRSRTIEEASDLHRKVLTRLYVECFGLAEDEADKIADRKLAEVVS